MWIALSIHCLESTDRISRPFCTSLQNSHTEIELSKRGLISLGE